MIPRNVCIEADDRLAGHLTDRDYVTLFGMQHDAADFVAIDLTQKDVGNFGAKPAAALATVEAAGYREIFRQDRGHSAAVAELSGTVESLWPAQAPARPDGAQVANSLAT